MNNIKGFTEEEKQEAKELNNKLEKREKEAEQEVNQIIKKNLNEKGIDEKEFRKTIETRKDELSYQNIKVIPETKVKINSLIYQGLDIIKLKPILIKEEKYNLYKTSLGEGQKDCFIITDPEEHLTLGTQNLSLKTLNFEILFKKYCNEKKRTLPDSFVIFDKKLTEHYKSMAETEQKSYNSEEILKCEFTQRNDIDYIPFFFEKIDPIETEELIEIIKKKGFETILNDFLLENGQIDKTIKYIFRINMVCYGNKYNEDVSKYQNHSLIITNTKTGKTTQLEKHTNNKYDNARASRLLGYSTADKTFEGDIQHNHDLIVLDDMTSSSYEADILDHLPSILENGKAKIGKGKQTLNVECSSQFILTTNAKDLIQTEDLVLEFRNIINKLGEVPQRLGSRWGCILFGNNFDKARINKNKQVKLNKIEIKNNSLITKQIFRCINNYLIKLLDENKIIDFLETQNQNYENLIKDITINQNNFTGDIKEFWKSTQEGYRHQRGFALKQGVLDYFLEEENNLINLINDELNISDESLNKIIELSEENLQLLNDINYNSLKKILDCQTSEEKYLLNRYNSLSRDYVKSLIKGAYSYVNKNIDRLEKLIPLILLNGYLDKEEQNYNRISRIKEKLPKTIERLNKDLETFGFQLIKLNDDWVIRFDDKIKEFCKFELGTFGTFGTKRNDEEIYVEDK